MPKVITTYKRYQCQKCGFVKDLETNHFGYCYPSCGNCGAHYSVWECLEHKPPEWADLFPIRNKLLRR